MGTMEVSPHHVELTTAVFLGRSMYGAGELFTCVAVEIRVPYWSKKIRVLQCIMP
jgi:hypothetical protein